VIYGEIFLDTVSVQRIYALESTQLDGRSIQLTPQRACS